MGVSGPGDSPMRRRQGSSVHASRALVSLLLVLGIGAGAEHAQYTRWESATRSCYQNEDSFTCLGDNITYIPTELPTNITKLPSRQMLKQSELLAGLMETLLKEAGWRTETLVEPFSRLLMEAVDFGLTNVVVQILARNLKDCIY